MAAGNVGKLSITVYPDTRKFKEHLKKSLERIERQVKARIEVIPVVKRSTVAAIRKDMREQLKGVQTTVDAELDDASVQHIKDQLNKLEGKATVNADLDKGKATAQMRWFDRPRTVPVQVRVNSASLAAAKTALMALSGGNVLSRMGNSLKNLGQNFDLISVKAASLGPAILSLSSVAMTATAGLVTLGQGMTAMLPAALALPGVLGGFAVGAGVLIAALKDTKTVLADLGPAFSGLQDHLSASFWDQAAGPIRDMVNTGLPALSDELGSIATAFGQMGASIAGVIGGHISGFEQTFSSVAQAVSIASAGVADFVDGLLSLGEVGASFLPAIATKANEVAASFKTWAANGLADGSIAASISAAWEAMKTFGDLISQVGGILGSVFSAIGASGPGGLSPLVETLTQINTALAAPAAQETLTAVFSAAREGVAALGPGLSSLLDSLGSLAPVLQDLLPQAGQVLSTALAGIGQAVESLANSGGLQAFFDGVQQAVQALAPAMPALGEAFGAVAAAAGSLMAALGPVIAQLVSSLAPVIVQLAGQLTPLISMLGSALVPVIQALAPVIAAIVGAVAPLIVQLVGALLPVIVQLVQVVAAILVPILQALTPLIQMIGQLFVALLPSLTPVLELLGQLAMMVLPLLVAAIELLLPIVETVFTAIATQIQAALTVIEGVLNVFIGLFTGNWSQAWEGVKQILSGAWDLITNTISGALSIIQSVISAALSAVQGIWSAAWSAVSSLLSSAWSGITSGVTSGISSMMNLLGQIPSKVKGIFSGAGSWLLGAGRQIIDGLVSGIRSAFSAVQSTLSSLTSMLPDWKGPAKVDKVILKPAGRMIIGGLVDGMESQYAKVERSLGGLTTRIPSHLDLGGVQAGGRANGGSMVNNIEIVNHDPQVAARYVGQELRMMMGVL